ncbi:cytochrome P450 [Acidisoma sp.]|uniref:cytochrome P450 n=1 Tax=Acidisoma sp. TaxID=1872115 RepID=UPI003B00D581
MPDAIISGFPVLTVAELEADPHGVFRRYRPLTPLIERENLGVIVLRASHIEALTRDDRIRQNELELLEQRGVTDGALFDLFQFSMVTSNGSAHRRRRSPFTRTFAAAVIAAIRPSIRQGANALIDEWEGEAGVDLVTQYASLIPARVISAILGLPSEDIPYFTSLVYSVSRFLSFTFSPEDLATIQNDANELSDYVVRLLAHRRATPESDFLSAFLAEAEARGELSAAEVIVQVVSLIIGGTDTTRVAMASQISLLLEHRDQWEAVCADPRLAAGAVREALRFEPSVASLGRVAEKPIALDGATVPAGCLLTLSTMSAMRDEAAYDKPDVFDIRRLDVRRLHPVFGAGAHRCIGEALAYTELEEGLCALTARLPGLVSAGPPARPLGHMGVRRIGAMPVTW